MYALNSSVTYQWPHKPASLSNLAPKIDSVDQTVELGGEYLEKVIQHRQQPFTLGWQRWAVSKYWILEAYFTAELHHQHLNAFPSPKTSVRPVVTKQGTLDAAEENDTDAARDYTESKGGLPLISANTSKVLDYAKTTEVKKSTTNNATTPGREKKEGRWPKQGMSVVRWPKHGYMWYRSL